MLEIGAHGGGCCGYAHVYGFDLATPADLDRIITSHKQNGGRGTNRILEAILTDRQLVPSATDNRINRATTEAGGWPVILAERGFRLAASWRNSNTERRCYQFLRIPTLLMEGARPFVWTGDVVPIIPTTPITFPVGQAPGIPARLQGEQPAPRARPVDSTLPILVWSGETRRYYVGTSIGDRITVRDPSAVGIRGSWAYEPDTGFWNGNDRLGRAINYDPTEGVVPAPAPAPLRVVTTEYYAHLRTAGRRGPFETVEEVREAYPRCRDFDQRQIRNDGTSLWTALD